MVAVAAAGCGSLYERGDEIVIACGKHTWMWTNDEYENLSTDRVARHSAHSMVAVSRHSFVCHTMDNTKLHTTCAVLCSFGPDCCQLQNAFELYYSDWKRTARTAELSRHTHTHTRHLCAFKCVEHSLKCTNCVERITIRRPYLGAIPICICKSSIYILIFIGEGYVFFFVVSSLLHDMMAIGQCTRLGTEYVCPCAHLSVYPNHWQPNQFVHNSITADCPLLHSPVHSFSHAHDSIGHLKIQQIILSHSSQF